MTIQVVDQERLRELCERYGIASLEVFGSVARGDAGPDSDIDLLFSLKPGMRLGWEIEDLTEGLSEILGRRVDLVSRRAIHRRMRDHEIGRAHV